MTDIEIYEKLQNIINVLNRIPCEGMQNLLNLGGGIAMLSEIAQDLRVRVEELEQNEK